MKQVDITLIINCHNEHEGILPTLRSATDARKYAEKKGLTVETLIVADSSDERMLSLLNTSHKNNSFLIDRIVPTVFSDLGMARNTGVQSAQGKFVSFLDGDDLYSENWLFEAWQALRRQPTAIAHPEVCLYFGRDPHWWRHLNSTDKNFSAAELLSHNYWTALSFSSRQTYLDFPYAECNKSAGLGYEDWHWNCETLANNREHIAVPRTAHYIRLKYQSMTLEYRNLNALIPKTGFFLRDWASYQVNSATRSWRALWARAVMFLHRFQYRSLSADRLLLRFLSLVNSSIRPPQWVLADLESISNYEPLLKRQLQKTNFLFRNYQYKNTKAAKVYIQAQNILKKNRTATTFYLLEKYPQDFTVPEDALVFLLQKPPAFPKVPNAISLAPLKDNSAKLRFVARFLLDITPTKVIVETTPHCLALLSEYERILTQVPTIVKMSPEEITPK